MNDSDFLSSEYWAQIWDHHIKDGRVMIPCYHPDVHSSTKSWSGILDDTVTREMFINPTYRANPACVDSSVDLYLGNMDRFVAINKRLREDHQHEECQVCLETFAANDRLVYNCHVFHFRCIVNLSQCPVCRRRYLG